MPVIFHRLPLYYLNLTNKQIKFIVDDSKAKQGLYTPGSKILIKDKKSLQQMKLFLVYPKMT